MKAEDTAAATTAAADTTAATDTTPSDVKYTKDAAASSTASTTYTNPVEAQEGLVHANESDVKCTEGATAASTAATTYTAPVEAQERLIHANEEDLAAQHNPTPYVKATENTPASSTAATTYTAPVEAQERLLHASELDVKATEDTAAATTAADDTAATADITPSDVKATEDTVQGRLVHARELDVKATEDTAQGRLLHANESDVKSTEDATASSTAATTHTAPAEAQERLVHANMGSAKKQIWIICYSMYGHIFKMAESVKAGIDAEPDVEGIIYQVAETLPEEVLAKMHAPAKPGYPIIDPHTLDQADGFVFGFPTRFGIMAAQMKSFFDATGQHWMKQSLLGKPAGLFTSTASQVGGQETTILTALPILAHHGMLYVPIGYGAGQHLFGTTEVRGGGPLGAGTIAADELSTAEYQGTTVAKVVVKLAK
eukprot:gene30165-35145_t